MTLSLLTRGFSGSTSSSLLTAGLTAGVGIDNLIYGAPTAKFELIQPYAATLEPIAPYSATIQAIAPFSGELELVEAIAGTFDVVQLFSGKMEKI